jgi:hypothetical protein
MNAFSLVHIVCVQPGEKKDDYWEPGKQLLVEPQKFLDSLFKFDKDNISDPVIKSIQPYIDNDAFQPAAIAKVNWIFACFWNKYHCCMFKSFTATHFGFIIYLMTLSAIFNFTLLTE